jgi:hypothetical protein
MEQRSTSELSLLRDYLDAFSSVRRARSIFLTVIILSLLAHVGAYVMARWGLRIEAEIKKAAATNPFEPTAPSPHKVTLPRVPLPSETQPASKPAGTTRATDGPKAAASRPRTTMPREALKVPVPATARFAGRDVFMEEEILIFLTIARFAGLAAAGLLVLTCLIAVNICLAGRMGGISDATSAFFWSIVLIALLFPWRHLIPGESIELPDAFFDLEQLRQGLAAPLTTVFENVRHYGRFIGCPALAILVSIVSGVRLSLAYRQVKKAVQPLVQMKVL